MAQHRVSLLQSHANKILRQKQIQGCSKAGHFQQSNNQAVTVEGNKKKIYFTYNWEMHSVMATKHTH